MRRLLKPVSALMNLVLLFSILTGTLLPAPALAGNWQDPLGLLPDWAELTGGELNPGAPADPLAGLVPPDPLTGLLSVAPASGRNWRSPAGMTPPLPRRTAPSATAGSSA